MSDATDKEAAVNRVGEEAEADAEPYLDLGELDAIVDRYQEAQRWVASTDLSIGDTIVPSTSNGHRYLVVTAGTTGTSEPTWPTGVESSLTNGTVGFEEAGMDYSNVYNIRAAIHGAWVLKRAKSAEFHEGAESEIFKHCDAMVKAYQTPMIA